MCALEEPPPKASASCSQALARVTSLEGENKLLKAELASAQDSIKGVKTGVDQAKVADKENGAQSPAPRKTEAKKGLQSPFPQSRLAIPGY